MYLKLVTQVDEKQAGPGYCQTFRINLINLAYFIMPILAFHKTSRFWGLIWRVRSTTAKVCSVFQNFCLLTSRCSLFTHTEGKRWNKSSHAVEEYMSLRWYRRLLWTTVCLPKSCKMASVCMHNLSFAGKDFSVSDV